MYILVLICGLYKSAMNIVKDLTSPAIFASRRSSSRNCELISTCSVHDLSLHSLFVCCMLFWGMCLTQQYCVSPQKNKPYNIQSHGRESDNKRSSQETRCSTRMLPLSRHFQAAETLALFSCVLQIPVSGETSDQGWTLPHVSHLSTHCPTVREGSGWTAIRLPHRPLV